MIEPPKRKYDLTKPEDIDAMEANLNEVEPSWLQAERDWGLLYGLEIGRRRMLIAKARAALEAKTHHFDDHSDAALEAKP